MRTQDRRVGRLHNNANSKRRKAERKGEGEQNSNWNAWDSIQIARCMSEMRMIVIMYAARTTSEAFRNAKASLRIGRKSVRKLSSRSRCTFWRPDFDALSFSLTVCPTVLAHNPNNEL